MMSNHIGGTPPSRDALDRYFAHESSLEEQESVRAWLAEGSAQAKAAMAAVDVSAVPCEGIGEINAVLVLAETHALLRWRDKQVNTPPPQWTRHGFGWIVGVALVVLGVGLAQFFAHSVAPSAVVQRYHTGAAQRATVRLADGSQLMLAPATSVIVQPAGIDVVGEVYFSITPHASRPVTVRTANAVMRVLGTSFVVRHYGDEPRTRVVVENGRVAVQSRQGTRTTAAPMVLSARMLAQIVDSGVTVLSSVEMREYVEWTRGTLVFNRVTLGSVVTELARAYGADIRVTDTTLAKHLMRMDVTVADDLLSDVLADLCEVTSSHVIRVGQAYVLVPGRSPTQLPRRAPVRRLLPQSEHSYGR
jgi:ferric-dicitrate binding protein FerR (iron transport regulator)